MENDKGEPFALNPQRQTDLELIADYFECQSWHESWPYKYILAAARVMYLDRAPFKVILDGVLYAEDELTDDIVEDTMFYMMDVRDKDGKTLMRQ